MFTYSIPVLLFCFVNSALCCCNEEYFVPEPQFELIYPRGFSVKIPHSEGISIFAFHGKINERMDFLEAGRFSKDVCNRSGDYWIFEDRSTNLRVGDKVYFWLFVIKNKLGYRYDNGEFTVKGDTPYRIEGIPQETTTITAVVSPSTVTNNEHITASNEMPSITTDTISVSKDCKSAILNITDALLDLRSEVNSLKEINEILKEISEKHPESARTLKIEGRIPVNENALVTVKGIIKQKLLLSVEIGEARRNKDSSITFKTTSLDDKVQIIKTAKEKLRYSRIYLTY